MRRAEDVLRINIQAKCEGNMEKMTQLTLTAPTSYDTIRLFALVRITG
jgi:hypothetical protein